MISFVVSAYERPRALRTCLSSLSQQTERDWEAIVVDNSEVAYLRLDNQAECQMDLRISWISTNKLTQIEGAIHKYCVYTATEIGVRMSRGDWLCFPNDDSYYCPWFVERMLAHAEQHDLDLVYSNIVMGGPKEHQPMICHPKPCCIDKTNFLLKRAWFNGFERKTGDDYPCADGLMIESLVKRGIRHGGLEQMLVVHN